jgi:hypothetical protein
VARAYAGHTDSGSETGATATYVRASLTEVAAALAALTGSPTRSPRRKGGDRHGCLRSTVAIMSPWAILMEGSSAMETLRGAQCQETIAPAVLAAQPRR